MDVHVESWSAETRDLFVMCKNLEGDLDASLLKA